MINMFNERVIHENEATNEYCMYLALYELKNCFYGITSGFLIFTSKTKTYHNQAERSCDSGVFLNGNNELKDL